MLCIIVVGSFIRNSHETGFFNVLAEEMVAIGPYLIAIYFIKLGLVQEGLLADFTSWDMMTCILVFLKLFKVWD